MRVYRVEHPNNGWGPYCNPFSEDDPENYDEFWNVRWGAMAHHDNPNTHPAPDASLGHFMEPDERCGFDSLDALLKWFDGALERLETLGFQVVEYYALRDKVVGPDDYGQVVFSVHYATLVC